MEKIPLPTKVEWEEESPSRARLVVEPCYSGYGITLGNALRRVLLSSLPGAAATGVRIKGVLHEFSTVPNVREDVVEIMLNLKQLRLQLFTDEPVKLELKAKGEKVVTAKDFEPNADVKIANTDLKIAELTDKNAELEMEVWVNKGRGYLPTEMRDKEKLEAGMVAIDAVYTPVTNVAFKTENVRVGQVTNYDRLILEVETDGTITAREALTQASDILLGHFNLFTEQGLTMMKERAVEVSRLEEEMAAEAAAVKAPEEAAAVAAVEVKAGEEIVREKAEEEIPRPAEEEPKKKRGRPRKA